jgi:hypothetical protein
VQTKAGPASTGKNHRQALTITTRGPYRNGYYQFITKSRYPKAAQASHSGCNAGQAAIKAVKHRLRADGIKPHSLSMKEISALADDYLAQHRTSFFGGKRQPVPPARAQSSRRYVAVASDLQPPTDQSDRLRERSRVKRMYTITLSFRYGTSGSCI